MDCARILATALLLGSLPASLEGAGQEASGGSQAAAQAPSAQAPSAAAPSSAPGDAQTPPVKQQPPAGQEESTKDQAAKKGSASPATKKKTTRKHGSQPAPGEPSRVVVRGGGANEPTAQLAPGLTEEQSRRQRQRTEELLDTTENNLRQLAGRTLKQNQQDTITQIRNYMVGARSALKDGDPQRARTLAFKARLLSDDLVKR